MKQCLMFVSRGTLLIIIALSTLVGINPPAVVKAASGCAVGSFCTYIPLISRPVGQDIIVNSVEITQAVQDAQNSVPLVAGRSTVMRIYVATSGFAQPISNVKVTVSAAGSTIGMNGLPRGFAATVPTSSSRAVYLSTINFTLPTNWLSGTVDLTIKVDPDNAISEDNESNNTLVQRVVFNPMPALRVKVVPILYTDKPTGRTFPAPSKDTVSDWIMRVYPISQLELTWHTPYAFTGDLRSGTDFNRLLDEITTLKSSESAPSSQVYYGLIPTSDGSSSWFSSGYAGLGWIGSRAAVGLDLSGSTSQIAAHEIGHNMGMPHTPCGVSGDPKYPYVNASIGQYGLDLIAGKVYDPSSAKDVMSYCDPKWISDYTYKFIYSAQSSIKASAQLLASTPSGSGSLLVRASIYGDSVELMPAYVLPNQAGSLPEPGQYTVQMLGQQGNLLGEIPVRAYETEGENGAVFGIHASLPLPAQPVATIRLLKEQQLVAERAVQVTTLNPLMNVIAEPVEDGYDVRWGWGNRTALLRYSADNDTSWTTLAVDVVGGQMHVPQSMIAAPGGTFDVVLADTWK